MSCTYNVRCESETICEAALNELCTLEVFVCTMLADNKYYLLHGIFFCRFRRAATLILIYRCTVLQRKIYICEFFFIRYTCAETVAADSQRGKINPPAANRNQGKTSANRKGARRSRHSLSSLLCSCSHAIVMFTAYVNTEYCTCGTFTASPYISRAVLPDLRKRNSN
jgi:hypothetical protein